MFKVNILNIIMKIWQGKICLYVIPTNITNNAMNVLPLTRGADKLVNNIVSRITAKIIRPNYYLTSLFLSFNYYYH